MDFGAEAMRRTIGACQERDILVCGAGGNMQEAARPVEKNVEGGIRVAILAFCEREFGVAGPDKPGAAWISHPVALEQVAHAAHTADVVVVMAHGGVEEVPFSPIQRQMQLRRFIDAGAALVIGHHPHVPQGWERYGQGLIFHSLGNFLFDFPSEVRYPKTEWGLLIKAHFAGSALANVELVPVETLSDRTIGEMGQVRSPQKYLEYLNRLSFLLSEPGALVPYWQEIAIHLWKSRYLPWMRQASGAKSGIRFHIHGLCKEIGRKLGDLCLQRDRIADIEAEDGLLLLNTIRNESHRWTLETALSVLHEDEVDCRTPAVQTEARELLEWTLETINN